MVFDVGEQGEGEVAEELGCGGANHCWDNVSLVVKLRWCPDLFCSG